VKHGRNGFDLTRLILTNINLMFYSEIAPAICVTYV